MAKDWGWSIVDAVEYVRIASLYGCEYGFKQGRGKADGVFGILQPPTPTNEDAEQGVDFSGDYVRVVTGVVTEQSK